MLLKKIYFHNYRNYQQEKINFNDNINVIIGENAQGKTNLMEGIYYLATGRSFRNNKDSEIIQWEKDFCTIKGLLIKKNTSRNFNLEINLQKNKNKEIKINGVKQKKISELLGYLQVILFSPEDLKIIKQGPSERRRYIDLEIMQLRAIYYDIHKKYYKVLQQRNSLLKEIQIKQKSLELLEVFDEQLVSLGSKVIKYRIEFLKKLVPIAREMQKMISQGKEFLDITYSSSIIDKPIIDLQIISNNFSKKLQEKRNIEIKKGITIIGPHRDDLTFYLNNKELKKFGSQGQQRTAVLALKLAELKLFFLENNDYPILLLDDVMSELDDLRRRYLIKLIKENNIQTFITGANLELLELNLEKSKVLIIEQGKVKDREE